MQQFLFTILFTKFRLRLTNILVADNHTNSQRGSLRCLSGNPMLTSATYFVDRDSMDLSGVIPIESLEEFIQYSPLK